MFANVYLCIHIYVRIHTNRNVYLYIYYIGEKEIGRSKEQIVALALSIQTLVDQKKKDKISAISEEERREDALTSILVIQKLYDDALVTITALKIKYDHAISVGMDEKRYINMCI